jgi:hypothetical protein
MLSKINDWVGERLPISLKTSTYPYKPGDGVWVKECDVQPLKPHWSGPFVVVLSSPTAVKVAEIHLDPLQPSEASYPQMGVHP